jgi:peptidoglycan lytic transglycosylase G
MKRTISGITLILVLLAAGLAGWMYRELRRPISHSKSQQYIEIPRGMAPAAVTSKLAAEGVLQRSWPLTLYLKITGGSSNLKAGEYRFPSPISPLGVYAKLRQGERRLNRVTVIEGWTRWDIANALAKIPELKVTNDEALDLMNDTSLIADIDPRAHNLEGYLYPDTYDFPPDTRAEAIVEMMVKRFRTLWKPESSEKALALKLTPRQIVTTASLIETEARLPEERPIIASVIYNRLRLRMPLGVDSTVIYASKLEGKWRNDGKVYKSDVDRRSPYNTRLVVGLPPGPIASPGQSSIDAALNPATTEYLYYVREPSRDDGAHNFYSDESSFSRGVQALRNWERERDANHAEQKPSTP